MENRGQTIFLSVIGIATLLVAIVGATFAWFSVNVQGNEDASSIVVTTATLGTVVFNDGTTINETSFYPGDVATKEFTVTSGEGATISVSYMIKMLITENTINDPMFTYSITGTIQNPHTTPGTLVSASSIRVPTADAQIGSNGVLAPGETHKYNFSIGITEANSDQNYLQGKTFGGRLSVETADTKYTQGGSTWTP